MNKTDEIKVLKKALEIAVEDINKRWEASNGKDNYIPLTVQGYIGSAINEIWKNKKDE